MLKKTASAIGLSLFATVAFSQLAQDEITRGSMLISEYSLGDENNIVTINAIAAYSEGPVEGVFISMEPKEIVNVNTDSDRHFDVSGGSIDAYVNKPVRYAF